MYFIDYIDLVKIIEMMYLCLKDGMKAALGELQKDLPWIERLDLTTDLAPAPKPIQDLEEIHNDGDSVHDDFKREMRL